MKTVAEGVAAAFGMEVEVELKQGGYLPVENNPALARELMTFFEEKEGIELIDIEPAMTGEDFGYLLSKVDGVMFWLGIDSSYALHHPQMSPKEEALAIGVDAVSSFPKEGSRVEGLSMKSELRKQVLQEMKSILRSKKIAMDQALTERFLNHPFYQEAKVIATYLSFSHEFQTQELIDQALKDGKKGFDTQNLSQGSHGVCGLRSAAVKKKLPLVYWSPKGTWKWWIPPGLI